MIIRDGTDRVSDLHGLPDIPSSKMGIHKWLLRHKIPLTQDGKRFTFLLSDLPAPVRLAVMQRDLAAAGLAQGSFDDVAHAELDDAPSGMRAEAHRKAEIARFLLTAGKGLSVRQKLQAIARLPGQKAVSKATLARISTAIKGVDPINFAPALLADYSLEGAARCAISDAAWSCFVTAIRDGGEGFPISAAWQDVHDLKGKTGWNWPSKATVFRRWCGLSVAEQLHARVGYQEAVKRLAQPALRDKTSILPMEWVSLDGRTLDFWAHDGDGKPRRYTFLALVDCATNFVLDWELAEIENARATVRLIKRVCQTYGVFDRLYPDNGSAFAGHLVAGGAVHRFRNSVSKMEGVKPLGICHHLGIRLHFALPANGQAKVAERAFATLSRVIDVLSPSLACHLER